MSKTKELICPKCGHPWKYSGRAKLFTSCPKCGYGSVPIGGKKELYKLRRLNKKGTVLGCKNCYNIWLYIGKSKKYTSCPKCRHGINIEKSKVETKWNR